MNTLRHWFEEDVLERLGGIEEVAQHLEPGKFQNGVLAGLSAVRASFGLPHTMLVIPNTKGERSQLLLEIMDEP